MKSKKNQNIVRVLFLLVLLFVGNYYLANPINNKVNREINNYMFTKVDILKTSGHWNLAPFVIDDSATGVGAHNWTWAETQPWCSGSGTLEEPYLIENVTIDGENSGSCLTIKNSDKYFRIENCTVFNSGSGPYDAGIHLDNVENGTLFNNNCSFNNMFGIHISLSNNNTISGNTANNNNYGINLYFNSDNNTVLGNTANNNSYYGIILYYSDNNTVSGNTANNNPGYGIWISHSDNTTVSGNIIDNNVNYGIYIFSSDYNLIYKNYFTNNGIHALDSGSYNDWNSSIIGNYWDNYTGYDDDFDGIGDTPHNFDIGTDYLPIWNFQSPIHIDDSATGVGAHNWTWAETQPWCSGFGTFSAPYIIDGLNITARGVGSSILIGNSSKYFIVRNCKLIESGSVYYDAGIRLDHAGNGTLINNTFQLNPNAAIYSEFSNNNSIYDNFIDASFYGIYLRSSNINLLANNIIKNGCYWGIYMYNCTKNTVTENYLYRNIYGIVDSYGFDNSLLENTVIENAIGIGIGVSVNTTISMNDVIGSTMGILAQNLNHSFIINNNISQSGDYGIILFGYSSGGNNNTISQNTIMNTNETGLGLTNFTKDNLIFDNDFIDNSLNAQDNGTFNLWDNGSIGNYWSDYGGVDANDDGIGDTPYIISGTAGSQDNYPIWADGDDIPPVITIISPLPDSVFGLDAPNYQITIGELNLDTIWYTLNGGGTNYTITGLTGTFNQLAWDALSEGNITIRFYANDTVGNIGSAAVTVEKDISAPVITIIFPLPDGVFDLVAPYYNISIDELNLDTIWYTLDGGITNYTITDLTGTFNQLAWGALSEGSLTIRFYANDTAGNIGFTDVEVIIEIPEDIDGVPIISFGNYYILFTFITILSFIILEKRKKK